ncbi:MAG: hypothetical protein AABZ43_02875 [Planctomycetota bacterium]
MRFILLTVAKHRLSALYYSFNFAMSDLFVATDIFKELIGIGDGCYY